MTSAARKVDSHPPPPEGAHPKSVLVALGGRRAPVGAIAMARLLANALHASIHGVFFWTSPLPVAQLPRLMRLTPEALDGIALEVVTGDPAQHLAAATASHDTAFVVVAAEPSDDPLGIGALAYETLLRADSGVVVVPPAVIPAKLERILVPLDGTPSTASALGPAGDLACAATASLHILLVGEAGQAHAPPSVEPGAMATPQYVDQPQHEWPAFANEFLQRFLGDLAHCPNEVRMRLYLGAGPPSEQILRFVDELETHLLVLVWSGQLDGEHGAVFRDVIRAAKCPVLVLKR